MKERPILFSAPMVRAILNGTKTQTRRVIKPADYTERHDETGRAVETLFREKCPYVPGDRLWVREEHQVVGHGSIGPVLTTKYLADGFTKAVPVTSREYLLYRARKKPWAEVRARFMYRSQARILLEITDWGLERLNDISEPDAKAEGAARKIWITSPMSAGAMGATGVRGTYREGYKYLWESLYGAGSWAVNPWVWVVEFRRVEA